MSQADIMMNNDTTVVVVESNGVRAHASLVSSGSNTLTSMETLDVNETCCLDDEDDEQAYPEGLWGRLFPIGKHFKTVDLCKHEYTFGRGDECDYSFNQPAMRKHPCFLAYSKVHFKLKRDHTSTGWHTFLLDCSSNGTFVNGVKVGRNKRQVLNNNDEVSLAMKKNRAFVYMDPTASDDHQFPEEICERYTMSKILGRGACGEVRLAFEKGTCRKFAIKAIPKKTFSIGGKTQVNLASEVMNEVKVLKALKHPCIIEVEDVIDTSDTLFIVLEHVEGGELFDRVVNQGQLDESGARLIFYQMVLSVKYLHDQGITHRDLKPENVLLATDDEDTLIKVTDFGLSKFVDGNTMMKTFCGTPNYLAPEVLLTAGTGSYTQAIDCWSLGVILFICLGGYPPFSEEYKEMTLTQQIVKGRYTFPDSYWGKVSVEAKDLIKRLMTVDPQKRISLDDALRHPWLSDEEMVAKVHHLMNNISPSNGFPYPPETPRRKKPILKRQREESDDTEDGNEDVIVNPTASASAAPPAATAATAEANYSNAAVSAGTTAPPIAKRQKLELSESFSSPAVVVAAIAENDNNSHNDNNECYVQEASSSSTTASVITTTMAANAAAAAAATATTT